MRGRPKAPEKGPVSCELLFILLCLAIGTGADAFAVEFSGKSPRAEWHASAPTPELPTSCIEITFLGAIKFYQNRLSAIRGGRCGFRPSCSRYGAAAIQTHGPLTGLLMTGDRLMRCHIWKKPGADYFLLPTGYLFDPLSNNLLFDQ